MALTRDFKELVQKRIAGSPGFRDALLREGIDTMLSGDVDTGKAILRDYIKATVGFKKLGEAIGMQPTLLFDFWRRLLPKLLQRGSVSRMNSSKAEASRFSARKHSLSYSGRGHHHIVAPFGKPCIEGCVGHTDRQPIHVAPLRLDGPWQLANILAHRGQHGSYGVFLLGFQIF